MMMTLEGGFPWSIVHKSSDPKLYKKLTIESKIKSTKGTSQPDSNSIQQICKVGIQPK